MTSVDDLFRRPNLPPGALKRKLEVPDAEAVYKASKIHSRSSPNGQASVEDVPDEGDDADAGPELPPEDDEDEDDEGRFFGGGVSKDQKDALNFIDEQDGDDDLREETIDSTWLKKLSNNFARKLAANAEQRARHEGNPAKFMESEAALDAEVKSWSSLSEHPELYPEFAKSASASSLVGLLAHENTDIAIGAIEIISELLDEDVQAEQAQWDALAAALLGADLLELLMSNLSRLDEEEESDRSGVYNVLAIMESLAGQQVFAEKIATASVLTWLFDRIQAAERPVGQNMQYAAEVLQVLLQGSPAVRQQVTLDFDGVDIILRRLAAYRKGDPEKDSHEEEYAENLFDALACILDQPDGKRKFVEAEGVELCVIMLKHGSMAKPRALMTLDHATGGSTGAAAVCERLVEAAGLKPIFHTFMKSRDNQTIEHLLGIFASMLRWLPGESAARIRTLGKFTEKKYEKVARLAQLEKDYRGRLAHVDEAIRTERSTLDVEEMDEEKEDEWLSRRLDGGLFCVQTIDVILAWLCAEDADAKAKIETTVGLKPIKDSLLEQVKDLGDAPDDTELKDMLETLISLL